ncbi:MAG: homocysteine S-methyltransferase family protein [Ignavibacteria bacterium]|jgi:5-methyltetrahydrofolate--homocysteine methyltransferase
MHTILDRLNNGEILVADGAMGTMLFERGLKPGDCPELLNLTKPEILEKIAKLYFEVGSDIIQTNTFGGSPLKLSEYGLEVKCEEINNKAVECVRKVIGDNTYISGSCGPSGNLLKPYGDTEPELMLKGFEQQTDVLVKAGVDIICIETMTDLREVVLAVEAAKNINPAVPAVASMTFDKIPKGYYTIMGVSIKDAVKGLEDAGADIIGSNCGNGIDNMIDIARQMKELSDKPVLIQSNAGIPENQDGKLIYPESPSYFQRKTFELIEAGVSIIGGCCGTTPEHIKSIRKTVDTYVRAST